MIEFEINWRVPVYVSTVAPRPKLGGASSEPTDQALCGSVGAKKTIVTMIELFSAWNIHE